MPEETISTSEQKTYGYGKRPLWQWILLYVVIGAIIYGIIYYFVFYKKGGYNYTSGNSYQYPTTAAQQVTTTQTPTVSISPSTSTAPSGTMIAEKITVTGTEFAFNPSTINAKVNEPITVTFKNDGTYPHNFTISELNVKTKTIQPGEEDTITFTPTKTGSFIYLCTVPGHADRGMKGTLIVQ